MSTPPNRYRDLHREVQTLGNRASGLGLLAEASTLWAVAAAIKEKGRQPPPDDFREWVRQAKETK